MLQFQPQEHLLHSYIVASQSEQARDRLSLDLAAAMLCRSDGVRPCRTCWDCRKVYDGVHPDVIYIAPDPDAKVPSIKVDQIRGVAATAYILPSEAEKKVYVLRQADTMNLNAQNAFLKLLEEPPQSAAFILAAASPELLLPTVRSRCALLRDPAEQLQESDEIRALAEDYLRAVALAKPADAPALVPCTGGHGCADALGISPRCAAPAGALAGGTGRDGAAAGAVRAAASPAGDLRALPPRQCRHEAYLWPAVRFGRAGESSEVRISN